PICLVFLENGRLSRYFTQQGLPANSISSLLIDHAGHLWIGTPAGLAQFSHGRFEQKLKGEISALLEDRQGTLWIGASSGLSRFRNGIVETYTTQQGLPNEFIISLSEDHDMSLWIGTRG